MYHLSDVDKSFLDEVSERIMLKEVFRRIGRRASDSSDGASEQTTDIETAPDSDCLVKRDYALISVVDSSSDSLDELFECVLAQDFDLSRVQLILVDVSLTGVSQDFVSMWRYIHPAQLVYARQPNGNVGSARNLGLAKTTAKWATFYDVGGRISSNFLEEFDNAISQHPHIDLAVCPIYSWNPETDEAKAMASSAAWRSGNDKYLSVGDDLPLIDFATGAFFRMDLVRSAALAFDASLHPTFAAKKFVALYMLHLRGGEVGYISGPRYYRRKNPDATLLANDAWKDQARYATAFTQGYLPLLEEARGICGCVPGYIRRLVLDELSWYFEKLVGRPERSDYIAKSGNLDFFLDCLRKTFSYFSVEELFGPDAAALSFRVKLGIAEQFLGQEPPFWTCRLIKLDASRNEMLVEAYTDGIEFYFDDIPAVPLEVKITPVPFCGILFFTVYRIWLPIPKDASIFSFHSLDERPVKLFACKNAYENKLTLEKLAKRYQKDWGEYEQDGNVWIVMDRDTQADDNAEHFYRYVAKNHPEQSMLFALRSSSPDWERLESEGFRLVDFGTSAFEKALRSCSKVISSHAAKYVRSYFGDDYHQSKDFVFLQHGIISNDLSTWLNSFDPDVMLTTMPSERDSIVQDGSPYTYTPKQVLLTGLPRHDSLIAKRAAHKAAGGRSTILVMPTWRRYLSGQRTGVGNERALNPDFSQSEYAKTWQSFLESPRLKEFADAHNLSIVFFPHASVLPYVESGDIALPPYVELGSCNQKSFQDYASEAAVCVTDYTSASFDTSLIRVPIVYYQFDRETFYGGDHDVRPGYFDFARDGFGPVAFTEDECLSDLERIAAQGFVMEELYAARVNECFPLADGQCCERVYRAICDR